MLGNSPSVLIDDFDEHSNEKHLFCSSLTNNSSSFHQSTFLDEFCDPEEKDEDLPLDDQLEATSTNLCRTTIQYDPRLAILIENELGLNDPQTSRKNAWGNLSYAELIGKAIENSEDKRLTLSQIYSWMIQYVPYFRDKGDRKSSTGWKNSIRHNLSLHNRFVRIPNEIAGKSSWWTIDPRAKQVRGRRRIQSNENCPNKGERRRLTKTMSSEICNPLVTSSSFDYLFSNDQQIVCSSSNDVFSSSTSTQQSFTSVRDMNKNLYNLFQTNSPDETYRHQYQLSTQPILHDMLKSSSPPNTNHNNQFNSGIESSFSTLPKSPSTSHCDFELDEMISSKLSKQLKTIDRSSPLFRRMVVAIMRHEMNKSKSTNNQRRQILSTPPSIPSTPSKTNLVFNSPSGPISTPTASSSSSSSSMDLELTTNSQNTLPSSTFDLDVEAILDFERTTFGDCSFDIHDLPNL